MPSHPEEANHSVHEHAATFSLISSFASASLTRRLENTRLTAVIQDNLDKTCAKAQPFLKAITPLRPWTPHAINASYAVASPAFTWSNVGRMPTYMVVLHLVASLLQNDAVLSDQDRNSTSMSSMPVSHRHHDFVVASCYKRR